MCEACGVTWHTPAATAQPNTNPAGTPKFAALRNRECATYLAGGALSMMGDSIEHVISYWVMYQEFHSPALAGFAVISHWAPSLLSV